MQVNGNGDPNSGILNAQQNAAEEAQEVLQNVAANGNNGNGNGNSNGVGNGNGNSNGVGNGNASGASNNSNQNSSSNANNGNSQSGASAQSSGSLSPSLEKLRVFYEARAEAFSSRSQQSEYAHISGKIGAEDQEEIAAFKANPTQIGGNLANEEG